MTEDEFITKWKAIMAEKHGMVLVPENIDGCAKIVHWVAIRTSPFGLEDALEVFAKSQTEYVNQVLSNILYTWQLYHSDRPRAVFHMKLFDRAIALTPNVSMFASWQRALDICEQLAGMGQDFVDLEPHVGLASDPAYKAMFERATNGNRLQ